MSSDKTPEEVLEQWHKQFEARQASMDERNRLAHEQWARDNPQQAACDHGVRFPEIDSPGERAVLQHMDCYEVKACFPRLDGLCPLGCGYCGIAYASMAHYVAGDW